MTLLFLLENTPADQARESQEGFFNFTLWLLILIPLVGAFVLAKLNRYKKQTVTEFTGDRFEEEVLQGPEPVLVHFYRPWSIGDQCMISQVEKIAKNARGFRVGFVDVEKYPELLNLYSNIGAPALLLFAGGRRVFQCEGVFDEADVRAEVEEVLRRQAPAREADSGSCDPSSLG